MKKILKNILRTDPQKPELEKNFTKLEKTSVKIKKSLFLLLNFFLISVDISKTTQIYFRTAVT